MEDLVNTPLAFEDALVALFDHSDHTLQRRVVKTYVRGLYQRGNQPKVTKQEAIVAAQDLAVQGHALFNLKDSNKVIPSHGKEMVEIVDILMRWTVLRFCESNTTCFLKVLEFLPEFFEALKNEEYTITECEASIFLPCIIEKLGHNIEKVREKICELAKLMTCIYPASKLFTFILEGLRSKNNRTRIESVDLLGFMIDRYGIEE